ncbi:type II toxin-antitoxin system HipA family toxin [Pontivivens ytuae]|uniref:Type II toxin-antitoxin system HipA family toxin n=1 Tax=Pontivivens ytuae TaxID=2789856 RepID=A0A7S9QDC3_9RHOB|nr:type II toxin-antitoxin system HipA family toxin [Pontivivens ytuae]QPH54740.1 type II toxin-antitoxin system HipA family toxin [Pontivivens ytuae]
MGRQRKYTPLEVFLNTRHVGRLTRQSSGAIDFQYAPEWLAWEHTMPISLSLPLREDRYLGAPVIAVFDNLLPDSDAIRRRVAERRGAEGIDAFSLLSAVGRDCVGALQFLPEGEVPDPADQIRGDVLDEDEIAAMIANLGNVPLGLGDDQDFRISIAGAQEKTALLYHDGHWLRPHGTTPTTHILKPQIGRLPLGVDLSHSVENEHLCLRLLEAFGLEVAQTEIRDFGEHRVLVVERFDRRHAADGRLLRLPQEDCCQALGVPPTRKYQNDGGPSAADILDLLKASDVPEQDRIAFLKAQILFWLMAATDGHAKNVSLFLRPGGRFRLTPLYDVISVQPSIDAGQLQGPKVKLAMSVGTNRHYRVDDIVARHFMQTAERAGLSRDVVVRLLEEIEAAFEYAFERVEAQLGRDVPEELVKSVKARMRGLLQRGTVV